MSEYRICEHDGCQNQGLYKAPKNRTLKEYYYFCLDHIREYNSNWNYFEIHEGEGDIFMQEVIYGNRKTTKRYSSAFFKSIKNIEKEFYKLFSYQSTPKNISLSKKEENALKDLGVSMPITKQEIKTQYKKLVKTYHPDKNNNKNAEEIFKKISNAYKIILESNNIQ